MYLFVFSDDSILKTGNTCNHSTPAQNPKSLYANTEVQKNPKDVLYYTGLPSHGTLKSLFEYVKDAIKESKVLTKFEQLLLCLIRLRLGVSIVDLSKRFQLSKTTVPQIFLDKLEVLYVYLKPLINWPERSELQISMPVFYR